VIWANFHDRDLLIKASFFTLLGSTALVLLDFSIATTWNFCGLKSHEFGVLHVWVALATVFVTKGL
jgi:hypothetical protein